MAGRGYGRGRGRGGHQNYARPVPFVLFPENITLPDANAKLAEKDTNIRQLIKWDLSFDSYFKAAPYLLDDTELKGRKRMHIERFSDKKKTEFTRDSLSQVLYFDGFVKELVPGNSSKQMRSRKKFRWNPEADAKKLAFFEELEKKFLAEEGKEGKDKKKKKEESEDEDENEEGKESEDDFADGDYNQNKDYDDDEDDFNDMEDGNDEAVY